MFSGVHYFIIKASSGLEDFVLHCAVLLRLVQCWHGSAVFPSLLDTATFIYIIYKIINGLL